MKTIYLLGAAAGALFATAAVAAPTIAAIPGVKNIIVIINDGSGNTVYDAARMYKGAPLTTDGAGFRRVQLSTYPLREDRVPDSIYSSDGTFINGVLQDNNTPLGLAQQASVVYDTAKFWDTTPVAGRNLATPGNPTGTIAGGSFASGYQAYPAGFLGYEWSRYAHPDSGNTASSLASGVRSYNNSINVDGAGTPSVTLVDLIDAAALVGKTTGIVSTVQFGDATPAAMGGAHNIARANRTQIAAELFSTGRLDVIGGTGNPDFDNNGVARTTPNHSWITAAHWADLKNKTNTTGLNALKWPLLQQRADNQKLATGQMKPPRRVAMIMRGFDSHQYNRAGVSTNPTLHEVYDPARDLPDCVTNNVPVGPGVACQQPPQANVPTQAELTLAALNVVGRQGKGFFMMSEAGAVDRAEHGNSTARMIEEQLASENTVQAVIDWVNRADTAATWENTLLIVTADHDHLLYGPQADTVPFQPLEDKGAGKTPGNKWFGPNHGTGLVPLLAYGKGADAIAALATQIDDTGIDLVNPTDGKSYHLGYGAYTDQPTVGAVLKLTAQNAN